MTKQIQTHKSTVAAKRFNLYRLLRSAVTTSVVAGCVSVAAAQTELPLPAFPSDTNSWSMPVSQESSTQPAGNVSAAFASAPGSRSAVHRASKLLGLKKRSVSDANHFVTAPAFAVPAFPVQTLAASTNVMPSFPSTAPRTGDVTQSTATTPTICCSSGTKSQIARNDTVVLASAQELPEPPQFSGGVESTSLVPSSLVTGTQPTRANPAQASFTDSASDDEPSAGESFSESLIDIEFPTTTLATAPILATTPAPVAQAKQRLPELVKRPPAMQLHIGGESNRKITTATQLQRPQLTPAATQAVTPAVTTKDATANFSLSDSSDSSDQQSIKPSVRIRSTLTATVEPITSVVPITNSNPMNVRIEGEPGIVQAIASSTPSVVNASTFSIQTAATTTAKLPSVGNSSRSAKHQSLSDNAADRAPAVGERLEVDLHEATNVETSQPISGLSIEHPELCQVLKSGERTISLVGLKAGQTRVALFTTDAAGERKIEIRDVVIAGTETRQADMKSMAADIGRSVHNMYPNSRIEVIAEAEGLTVQGYASTEDEAKKIISLVRRTSLQPVVDRLATYK